MSNPVLEAVALADPSGVLYLLRLVTAAGREYRGSVVSTLETIRNTCILRLTPWPSDGDQPIPNAQDIFLATDRIESAQIEWLGFKS
ncbi:hypothetical protein [Caballeronia grimmiae]|uniref:hypothetical protein n=1 Tax=Caballeronia grimmiae TaxID=1071679 RepID=UPI0038B87792